MSRTFTCATRCCWARSASATGSISSATRTRCGLLRNGPYLVEINLISNLLLEYVKDYSQHPFPEYLRIGIPVALSTDDRGMWDSNMTDEYFVAVREFNLSWSELVKLGRNSLRYSFVDEPTKQRLLTDYDKRVAAFA